MTKYRYMSKITGELHENIWGVVTAVLGTIKRHAFISSTPKITYIKYIFMWEYSQQGF